MQQRLRYGLFHRLPSSRREPTRTHTHTSVCAFIPSLVRFVPPSPLLLATAVELSCRIMLGVIARSEFFLLCTSRSFSIFLVLSFLLFFTRQYSTEGKWWPFFAFSPSPFFLLSYLSFLPRLLYIFSLLSVFLASFIRLFCVTYVNCCLFSGFDRTSLISERIKIQLFRKSDCFLSSMRMPRMLRGSCTRLTYASYVFRV